MVLAGQFSSSRGHMGVPIALSDSRPLRERISLWDPRRGFSHSELRAAKGFLAGKSDREASDRHQKGAESAQSPVLARDLYTFSVGTQE